MRRPSPPMDHQQPAQRDKRNQQSSGANSRFRNRDWAEQREDYRDDDR